MAKTDPQAIGVRGVDARPGRSGAEAKERSGVRALLRPDVYLPLCAFVAFLVAWETFGRLSNPILFAPPSAVAAAFAELVASGRLPRAFLITLN
ncbi:MAG: hypothetical protein ACRDU8_03225, partial [Egibacteraceae bacterium]